MFNNYSEKSLKTIQSQDFQILESEKNIQVKNKTPYLQNSDGRDEVSFYQMECDNQNEISFSDENITKSIQPQSQFLEKSVVTQCTEINALQQQRQAQISRPVQLNILVAGQSGVGKTTFVKSYLKQSCFKDYNSEKIVCRHLRGVDESASIVTKDVNLHLSFLDIKGFKSSNQFLHWVKSMKKLVTSFFSIHQRKTELLLGDRNQYLKESKKFIFDSQIFKIHVCLYFISNPKLSEEDQYAMQQLSQVVNIIPILSKGDSYTKEEQKIAKIQLQEQIKSSSIQIYDFLESLPESCKYRELIMKSDSPPFAIVSSQEIIDNNQNNIYGRQYAWGVCNVWNPEHSDLKLLHKLLIGYCCFDLIQLTDFYYNRFIQQKKYKKKLIKKQQKIQDEKNPLNVVIKLVFQGIIKLFTN